MDLKAVDQGEAKRIIALQEGHFLDHKNMRISPAKLSESISALANASGGELFVGIAETTDKKSKCWEGYPDLAGR
jgi:ATP-dependent DNA helicase RecG